MFGLKRREFVVLPATDGDYGRIAELHAQGFARGWSKVEVMDLAANESVFMLLARQVGAPEVPAAGFNIVQQTPDEAEILSVGVDEKSRRNGIGGALMREAIRRLQADRVPVLFLEVDATNIAAVHLYERLGFKTVGSRPGYYPANRADATAGRATALVMRLELV